MELIEKILYVAVAFMAVYMLLSYESPPTRRMTPIDVVSTDYDYRGYITPTDYIEPDRGPYIGDD